MKLSLLLLALGIKLKLYALISKDFRKELRKRDFVVAIRTEDGRRARTFHVKKGRVKSRRGRGPDVEAELVWCDADTAVRVMLSKNELDGFSAIGRSQLRILGNFEYAFTLITLAS